MAGPLWPLWFLTNDVRSGLQKRPFLSHVTQGLPKPSRYNESAEELAVTLGGDFYFSSPTHAFLLLSLSLSVCFSPSLHLYHPLAICHPHLTSVPPSVISLFFVFTPAILLLNISLCALSVCCSICSPIVQSVCSLSPDLPSVCCSICPPIVQSVCILSPILPSVSLIFHSSPVSLCFHQSTFNPSLHLSLYPSVCHEDSVLPPVVCLSVCLPHLPYVFPTIRPTLLFPIHSV